MKRSPKPIWAEPKWTACRRGRPAAGAAALSTAFGPCSRSEATRPGVDRGHRVDAEAQPARRHDRDQQPAEGDAGEPRERRRRRLAGKRALARPGERKERRRNQHRHTQPLTRLRRAIGAKGEVSAPSRGSGPPARRRPAAARRPGPGRRARSPSSESSSITAITTTIESAGISAHHGLLSRVEPRRQRPRRRQRHQRRLHQAENRDRNGERRHRQPMRLMPLECMRTGYSHSIVAGGFEEMSSATRFTSVISLMIRLETRSSRS